MNMSETKRKPILQIHPLKHCQTPAYPTKLEVLSNTTLLEKHKPSAWKKKAFTITATTFLAGASFFGCQSQSSSFRAVCAPISKHGKGIWSFAFCGMSGGPNPLFLPEEAVRQLIKNELRTYDLNFTQQDVIINNVEISQRVECAENPWEFAKLYFNTNKVKFHGDLYDPKKKVFIEYLSKSDYQIFTTYKSNRCLEQYIDAANHIRNSVRRQGKNVYFGVIYDPIEAEQYVDIGNCTVEEQVKRLDHTKTFHLLRLQIRDFAEWLKAQGVI